MLDFLEKQTLFLIFLRIQTDPILTLQMKLTDHVPIREDEIETHSGIPDVPLSNITEKTTFSKEVQSIFDEQFITELKAHDLYE